MKETDCPAWQPKPPENDGDFYYCGPTPDGKILGPRAIVGIVKIKGIRHAYIFIPPEWKGDTDEKGTLHCGELEKWKGEWAGPEYGLCTVTQ